MAEDFSNKSVKWGPPGSDKKFYIPVGKNLEWHEVAIGKTLKDVDTSQAAPPDVQKALDALSPDVAAARSKNKIATTPITIKPEAVVVTQPVESKKEKQKKDYLQRVAKTKQKTSPAPLPAPSTIQGRGAGGRFINPHTQALKDPGRGWGLPKVFNPEDPTNERGAEFRSLVENIAQRGIFGGIKDTYKEHKTYKKAQRRASHQRENIVKWLTGSSTLATIAARTISKKNKDREARIARAAGKFLPVDDNAFVGGHIGGGKGQQDFGVPENETATGGTVGLLKKIEANTEQSAQTLKKISDYYDQKQIKEESYSGTGKDHIFPVTKTGDAYNVKDHTLDPKGGGSNLLQDLGEAGMGFLGLKALLKVFKGHLGKAAAATGEFAAGLAPLVESMTMIAGPLLMLYGALKAAEYIWDAFTDPKKAAEENPLLMDKKSGAVLDLEGGSIDTPGGNPDLQNLPPPVHGPKVKKHWWNKIFDNDTYNSKGATTNSNGALSYTQKKEGFKPTVYNDVGHPAIGFGHDLTPEEQESGTIALSSGEKIDWRKGITKQQGQQIYQQDMQTDSQTGMDVLKKKGVDVSKLDSGTKNALADLSYNAGPYIFNKTPKLVAALKTGDKEKIAAAFAQTATTVNHGVPMAALQARANERRDMVLAGAAPIPNQAGTQLASAQRAVDDGNQTNPGGVTNNVVNSPVTNNNVNNDGNNNVRATTRNDESTWAYITRSIALSQA